MSYFEQKTRQFVIIENYTNLPYLNFFGICNPKTTAYQTVKYIRISNPNLLYIKKNDKKTVSKK